jgi:hypothetical protein
VLTLRAAVLALLASGCAGSGAGTASRVAPATAADYRPAQLRVTAVAVRVAIGAGADVPESERASLARLYESALLEQLDARALVVRDVQPGASAAPPAAAAARARDVGADHAIVVDVRVEPALVRVCEDTARPLQGRATVFSQRAIVVRASDGAVRATTEVAEPAVEVDCDASRPTARPRSAAATTVRAVERLLGRMLDR